MTTGFGVERVTVVWIDARRAVIARWDGEAQLETIESDVPSRHRSTGHQRHDPTVRHGGGGPATNRIERERDEHLRAWVDTALDRLPADDDLLIVGPGQVREQLLAAVHEADEAHRRTRIARTQPARPMTDRQLIAMAREASGTAPPRRRLRTAGAA